MGRILVNTRPKKKGTGYIHFPFLLFTLSPPQEAAISLSPHRLVPSVLDPPIARIIWYRLFWGKVSLPRHNDFGIHPCSCAQPWCFVFSCVAEMQKFVVV